jgi:hypothetical protein
MMPLVMANIDHEIDPEGDLIVVLRNIQHSYEPTKGRTQDGMAISSNENNESGEEYSYHNALSNDSSIEIRQPESEIMQPSNTDIVLSEDDDDNLQEPSRNELNGQTRIRVSAKHLTHASHTLKSHVQAVMSNVSKYSQADPELMLFDDEPKAMLVLLMLIHARTSLVPRTMDLAMLVDIAILVNKYDLNEIVSFATEYRPVAEKP